MPKIKTDKNTILKEALGVFYEKGYYSTTLSDLSKACGIEKPHFYYYFNSKKGLMEEVLLYIHAVVKKLILNKAYNGNYTPGERLQIMMDNVVKLNLQVYPGCIMGNTVLETSGTDDDFQPLLQNYFNDWIQALSHVYTSKYSKEEAEAMAEEDLQYLQGSMMFMKLYNDRSHLLEAVQKIKTRI